MSEAQLALGAGQLFTPEPLSEADLLAVVDRVLPPEYLDPLRANGPGYEVFQAGAAVMARISLAIARNEGGLYFLTARGGSFSAGEVSFAFGSAKAYDVTVKAGTVVRAPRGGQEYVTQIDVTVTAGNTSSAPVAIKAVAPGWEYDVRGPLTTAAGESLPAEIQDISLPLLDPPGGALDVYVVQSADVTGGAAPMLDMLAHDHDVDRRAGELDPSLASRARSLPDVVSPDAILRLLDRYLGPRGIPYQALAWWEFRWNAGWDVGPVDGTGKNPAGDITAGDTFFWDDPRFATDKVWRNRWASPLDRGAVAVGIPSLPAGRSRAFLWDDPGIDRVDHLTAGGKYAFGGWDIDQVVHPSILTPCWDGPDPGVRDVLAGLKKALDGAMAGGYNAFLVLLPGAADPVVLAALKQEAIAAGAV